MTSRRRFIRNSAFSALAIGLQPEFSSRSYNSEAVGGKKVGIIGLDTSHVVEFTKALNSKDAGDAFLEYKIVAAYPTSGSADLSISIDRIDKFTEQVRDMEVEIVNSISELLKKVDVVLLESVDGRPHLKEALPVLYSGKRMFIDKPVSSDLAGAIAIGMASEKYKLPIFSCSSLRFDPEIINILDENGGTEGIRGASTFGPASVITGQIDMAWYGIHGIESLFTFMGTGCKSVRRMDTGKGNLIVGTWEDGRIGSFNALPEGIKSAFGATVFGNNKIYDGVRLNAGYKPMLMKIIKYFDTGKIPFDYEQTIEIFSFMQAADESKLMDGRDIDLESTRRRAAISAHDLLSEAEADLR